jgi:[acyl-carrier-protein] S-malonyltransferase
MPVRWAESVRKIADAHVRYIVECGPGRVLSGLTRRIAPEVESLALLDEAALMKAREAVAHV